MLLTGSCRNLKPHIGKRTNHHLFDNWAIFAMKAWFTPANALTTREELAKYLDAPAFARGDLYYIQNLVAAIEAPSNSDPTAAAPSPSDNAKVSPAASDLTVAGSCPGYWSDMPWAAVLRFNPGTCSLDR